MKTKLSVLVTVIILFISACGGNTEKSGNVTGVWIFQHEPVGYNLKADLTYEIFEATENHTIIENGTWEYKNNKLYLTKADKSVDEMEVHFIDNYLFLGKLPTDEDLKNQGFATVNDYVKEWGYLNQKL